MAAGLVLILVSALYLRGSRAFSALPRPIATGSLVDSGPYRLVRHPLYTGLILAAIGEWLMHPALLPAIVAIGLAVVLDLKRRREEALLSERYPGYAAYRIRTKALIPFLY